jgi:hypothetical protein
VVSGADLLKFILLLENELMQALLEINYFILCWLNLFVLCELFYGLLCLFNVLCLSHISYNSFYTVEIDFCFLLDANYVIQVRLEFFRIKSREHIFDLDVFSYGLLDSFNGFLIVEGISD